MEHTHREPLLKVILIQDGVSNKVTCPLQPLCFFKGQVKGAFVCLYTITDLLEGKNEVHVGIIIHEQPHKLEEPEELGESQDLLVLELELPVDKFLFVFIKVLIILFGTEPQVGQFFFIVVVTLQAFIRDLDLILLDIGIRVRVRAKFIVESMVVLIVFTLISSLQEGNKEVSFMILNLGLLACFLIVFHGWDEQVIYFRQEHLREGQLFQYQEELLLCKPKSICLGESTEPLVDNQGYGECLQVQLSLLSIDLVDDLVIETGLYELVINGPLHVALLNQSIKIGHLECIEVVVDEGCLNEILQAQVRFGICSYSILKGCHNFNNHLNVLL